MRQPPLFTGQRIPAIPDSQEWLRGAVESGGGEFYPCSSRHGVPFCAGVSAEWGLSTYVFF